MTKPSIDPDRHYKIHVRISWLVGILVGWNMILTAQIITLWILK